ncbi:MAG: PAS domain S-box protein [Phycisphaerales bacterium]
MHSDTIKILIVDDLQDKLLVYRSILEEPGLEVVEAHSGKDALQALLRDEYAVALLDVNMPDMDGFETAALIRARKRCAHMPIIFVTAHSDEMHVRRGYQYGAVDYILTPVVPEVLRTKVSVFVQLFRMGRQASEQAARELARAEGERARLAAVLENSSDLVGRVGLNGGVTLNGAGLGMLGYEGRRAPRADQSPPPWVDGGVWKAALLHATSDGLWFGETALHRADGNDVPVSLIVLAHRSPGGGLESFSVVARDISARRRAEQSLAESERRYRDLVESLPAAVFTCDAEGHVELYNQAATDLWGREPVVGRDRWSGAWRQERLDGTELTPADCPVARILRGEEAVVPEEFTIVRSDGTRRQVIPHPRALRDAAGHVIGVVNMLMDITDLRSAEQSRSLLAQIVNSTDDAVISKSLDGLVTWCNRGAEKLFGYPAAELVGRPGRMLIPQEFWADEAAMLAQIRAGEHVEHYDTLRRRKDGSLVDVSISLSPVRDSSGRIVGASKIARDITERRRAEQELKRHREHLEQLVQERTSELRESHDRLRQADRLASIGTLAAGLGHDMGNLLLPVRMRLDALEQLPLPAEAREDLAAIYAACEYLNKLSQGLRLLAMNPDKAHDGPASTDLARWWQDSFPFLRSILPADVSLTGSLDPALPEVAVAAHVFTQVVFNLVQNAGDALRGRPEGRIVVSAREGLTPGFVVVEVSDNGPGMSEEAKARCLEPFFTTKTRSISTGLGLALVAGAVRTVGGQLEVHTRHGEGATFRMLLPAAAQSARSGGPLQPARHRACVDVSDARTGAYVATILRSMGVEVDPGRWRHGAGLALVVVDGAAPPDHIRDFLAQDPGRMVIVLGRTPESAGHERVVCLKPAPPAADIRAALDGALKTIRLRGVGAT